MSVTEQKKSAISETMVVVGGQLVQLVLTFGTSLMIARILNAEGYGVVNLLKTLFITIASIAPLGLDLALLKYCGKNSPNDPVFQAIIRYLRQIAFGFSLFLVFTLSFAVYFTPLGAIYTYKDFHWFFVISIIAMPFAVDTAILGALYKSNGQAAQYSYMTQYLQSFTRLSLIILAAFFSPTLETIIWISTVQLVSSSIALLVHGRIGIQKAPPNFLEKPKNLWPEAKSVFSVSIWMCTSLFAYGLMRSGDLMFLGAYSDAKNLGEYAALATVAQLIMFYPIAASQSLGPDVSKDFHTQNFNALKDRLFTYTYSAAIVSGFVFGGIAIFGQRLDLVLGGSFHFQPIVCLLIAATQFTSATLAPTGYALSMTGHHRAENLIILAGCLLLIVLLFVLVPAFGQTGAASASLIAIMALNATRLYKIKKTVGFLPLQFQSVFPPLTALGLAFGCFYLDQFIGSRNLIVTFFSCLFYTILYAVCCYCFFITPLLKQQIQARFKRVFA